MICLYNGDCVDIMKNHIPNEYVDLTITSPPYDNARDYHGYTFDYKQTSKELYRVTKDGGVCVWIVADQTQHFCETLTSFKQAIYFVEEANWNLLDTMIYYKNGGPPPFPAIMRYNPKFEYMFVFSKGKPKTFNPIQYKKKWINKRISFQQRQKDGSMKHSWYQPTSDEITMDNVWQYDVGGGKVATDNLAHQHPAIFSEHLASDHIISWSNEGDTVLDPMMGSGTTGKISKLLNRNFIGIEISKEYFDLATERINGVNKLEQFFDN